MPVATAGFFLAVQSDGNIKALACLAGHCDECNTSLFAQRDQSITAPLSCCASNRVAGAALCGQCVDGTVDVSGDCIGEQTIAFCRFVGRCTVFPNVPSVR